MPSNFYKESFRAQISAPLGMYSDIPHQVHHLFLLFSFLVVQVIGPMWPIASRLFQVDHFNLVFQLPTEGWK